MLFAIFYSLSIQTHIVDLDDSNCTLKTFKFLAGTDTEPQKNDKLAKTVPSARSDPTWPNFGRPYPCPPDKYETNIHTFCSFNSSKTTN